MLMGEEVEWPFSSFEHVEIEKEDEACQTSRMDLVEVT